MVNKTHIVQVGCGVVGQAYVNAYRAKGNAVTGIEANPAIVERNKAEIPMFHVNDDMSSISNVDFIMLSINTPLKDGKLDMSYLLSSVPSVTTIVKNNPDTIVLVRSTVNPGTTREYQLRLEKGVGHKVRIGFQPEFLRAASADEDAINPWCVVFGLPEEYEKSTLERLVGLYGQYIDSKFIEVITIDEAELLKMFHNSFNACKISFFNNCHLLCNAIREQNGVNVHMNNISKVMVKTCEGLLNPAYGTKAGHAYYGVCLPKDATGLAALEREHGLPTRMFQSVVDVNNELKDSDKEEVLAGDHHLSHQKLSQTVFFSYL